MKKLSNRLKICIYYLLITTLLIAEMVLAVLLAENGVGSAIGIIGILLIIVNFAVIVFLAVLIVRTEIKNRLNNHQPTLEENPNGEGQEEPNGESDEQQDEQK